MFAVIETGGKQYRVQEGDVIEIERVSDSADGAEIDFDRVLMLVDGEEVKVGSPVLDGVSVSGSVVGDVKGPKLRVFKMKRRKGYRRTRGHRQQLQRVRIGAISV